MTACNYNADATDEDGSCTYADEGYDCDGNCLNDADGDGVCDEFEIEGCTDAEACNYDATATDDNGSCTYAEAGYDCDGNCLNDADGDVRRIAGCQDEVYATDTNYAENDCEGNCLNDMSTVCVTIRKLPGRGVTTMLTRRIRTERSMSCTYDSDARRR